MSSPPKASRRISWHSSTHNSPTQSRHRLPDSRAGKQGTLQEESDGDESSAILPKAKGSASRYGAAGTGRDSEARRGRPGGQEANEEEEQQLSSEEDAVQVDGAQGGSGRRLSRGRTDNDDEGESQSEELPWWKRVLEKYGSVELENKGSVARDHLALERTFLAWLRTSLSFASIGIAVTQLFRLNTTLSNNNPNTPQMKLRHVGKPLGATFLAIGIITLLLGFHRYFESQHYVIRGKFPASRGSVILVALLSAALIVASFVVVLTIAPRALVKA